MKKDYYVNWSTPSVAFVIVFSSTVRTPHLRGTYVVRLKRYGSSPEMGKSIYRLVLSTELLCIKNSRRLPFNSKISMQSSRNND